MFPFTLQQLRILHTIVVQQKLTKAAEVLYLSQPLLSNRLTVLETNLNSKLFHRRTDKIDLTRTGEIFVKYSERVLSLCEESCRILAKTEKNSEKRLKIGILNVLPIRLLPKLLEFCSNLNFQLSLKFLVNSDEKITEYIRNQKLNFAFVNGEVSGSFNADDKTQVTYYTIDCICLHFSSIYREKKITSTEVYNLTYITLNFNDTRTEYLNPLLEINQFDIYQFKTIIEVNSIKNLHTMIKLGLGTSFNSSIQLEKEINCKAIRIIGTPKTVMIQNLYLIEYQSNIGNRISKFLTRELQKSKNFA